MNNKKVTLNYLLKARDRFEEYCQDLSTEKDKVAAVQAFEYCYELSWKILRKLFQQEGVPELNFSKDLYRHAASLGLIDDPETWFKFISLRNKTVHTYSGSILEEVVEAFPFFSKELNILIERLQKKYKFDE